MSLFVFVFSSGGGSDVKGPLRPLVDTQQPATAAWWDGEKDGLQTWPLVPTTGVQTAAAAVSASHHWGVGSAHFLPAGQWRRD